jgi:hypothetical protein
MHLKTALHIATRHVVVAELDAAGRAYLVGRERLSPRWLIHPVATDRAEQPQIQVVHT